MSTLDPARPAIAFVGMALVARGTLADVAAATARALAEHPAGAPAPLILDAETSEPFEVDLRGGEAEVLARLAVPAPASAPRRPGRPKLGVVAREVTLLPRHWEWLAEQPGGASVTLRKLVEAARRDESGEQRTRRAQDVTYRFLLAVAGDAPGYEAALRALYAGDAAGFSAATESWPEGLREHARELAAGALEGGQ